MQWTEDSIKKTAQSVVEKAVTDPEFRALALSEPKKAIAQINPEPIPDSYKIRFVDNARATFTLVLPDMAAPEGELSDAQLEQVAGGRVTAAQVGDAIGDFFGGLVSGFTSQL